MFPGQTVSKAGLPDQGTGWYSAKLPFANWVKLQLSQRLLMNFIELAPILIITSLIAGIYFPAIVVYTTWISAVGRLIYSIGYMQSPKGRLVGFTFIILCQLVNIVLAFTSSVFFIQKGNQ